jgi:hypothetical protein
MTVLANSAGLKRHTMSILHRSAQRVLHVGEGNDRLPFGQAVVLIITLSLLAWALLGLVAVLLHRILSAAP